MPFTTFAVVRNSPRSWRPSSSVAIVCARSPLATELEHATDLGGRLDEIRDQAVERVDADAPVAAQIAERRALPEAALLADDRVQARDLLDEPLVLLDHVVERLRDLAGDADLIERHACREVAAAERAQRAEQLAERERSSAAATITLGRPAVGYSRLLRDVHDRLQCGRKVCAY
jgi:hypothetical protein